jgi:hypothetical protein
MVSYPHGPAKEDVCPFCLRYTWLGACDGVKVRLEYSPVTLAVELAGLTRGSMLSYYLVSSYVLFRFPEDVDSSTEKPVHLEHRCTWDDRSPLMCPDEEHDEDEDNGEPPF